MLNVLIVKTLALSEFAFICFSQLPESVLVIKLVFIICQLLNGNFHYLAVAFFLTVFLFFFTLPFMYLFIGFILIFSSQTVLDSYCMYITAHYPIKSIFIRIHIFTVSEGFQERSVYSC